MHEAYIRLGGASCADRSGFVRAAAVAMQRILVDHACRRKAARRGGARTIALDGDAPSLGADADLVLDIDAALERLAQEDPSSAEVARHRLFAGLSIDETAEAMGVSRATALREWAYARAPGWPPRSHPTSDRGQQNPECSFSRTEARSRGSWRKSQCLRRRA